MLLLFVLLSFFQYRYPLMWSACSLNLKTSIWTRSEPPHILLCHWYPVGRLLSFLLWVLVSSGHALQGQTCHDQNLAIKHSFTKENLVSFPSWLIVFSGRSTPLNEPVISSTWSVHFAASFWSLFSNQLCSFICAYYLYDASIKNQTKSQTSSY